MTTPPYHHTLLACTCTALPFLIATKSHVVLDHIVFTHDFFLTVALTTHYMLYDFLVNLELATWLLDDFFK